MDNNVQRFIAVLLMLLLSCAACMAIEGRKAGLLQVHHTIRSQKQKNKHKQHDTRNKLFKRSPEITIDLAHAFATNARLEQVDRQGKVDFDSVGPISGILSNAAKTTFTVLTDGVYLIEFYVGGKLVKGLQNVGNESGIITFQLFRNGRALRRAEYSSATQSGQQELGKIGIINGFALVSLNSGDKICLVNTSDQSVLLANTGGPLNAAMKIIQITGSRIGAPV